MIKKTVSLLLLLTTAFTNVYAACSGSEKLLLHMNGADTSTTFTDSSTSAHTVTASGNAQIDTAQSKFGGASGLLDGTGDYLTVPSSADFDFGTGDFTVDFWIRFNNVTGSKALISRNNDEFGITKSVGNTFDVYLESVIGARPAWTPSTGVWYHVAVIRTGTTLRQFIDGTQLGTDETRTENISSSSDLLIGQTVGIQYVDGWYDEFRVVKGTAVWTANFTPETTEYCSARRRITIVS